MTANLGNTDRILRSVLGLLFLLAPLAILPPIWSNGFYAYGSMAVGLVLIATAFFRFCPLYRVFGMSSCKI